MFSIQGNPATGSILNPYQIISVRTASKPRPGYPRYHKVQDNSGHLADTLPLDKIEFSDVFFFFHLYHPFLRHLVFFPAYRILFFRWSPIKAHPFGTLKKGSPLAQSSALFPSASIAIIYVSPGIWSGVVGRSSSASSFVASFVTVPIVPKSFSVSSFPRFSSILPTGQSGFSRCCWKCPIAGVPKEQPDWLRLWVM